MGFEGREQNSRRAQSSVRSAQAPSRSEEESHLRLRRLLKNVMEFIKREIIAGFLFLWRNKIILISLLVPIALLTFFLLIWFSRVSVSAQIIFTPISFANVPSLGLYIIPFFASFILVINLFLTYVCRACNRLVIYFLLGNTIAIEIIFLALSRFYITS